MTQEHRIGYVGVNVLANATVCNEATGLLRSGVPLEVVSVYPQPRSDFYQDDSLAALRGAVSDLYPLRPREVAAALLLGPFAFGRRYWSTLARAVFCRCENVRAWATLLYQVLPALVLAMRWRSRGIGHIHAHWAHTATGVAMHAAGFLGVGFSFTGHANDLFSHRVGLLTKVRRARFIVCISEFHRQFYLGLGADPGRLKVVYCGIDTARFSRREAGPDGAGVQAPPRPRPHIVSVGRLVEKKGFHDLIAACALLRDEGVAFTCTIAGSGPEHDRLERLVAERHLESCINLTGRNVLQEDLPALLASADLFVLPCVRDREGDMDGLPQVLIESLLCGVPVVSTRLVGIPDLVRHGVTGWLVEPGDIRATADAVRTLLDSPELARRLAAEGRSWALEHFGLDRAVDRLARLFRWALSHPGHSSPDLDMPAAGAPEPPTPSSTTPHQDRGRASSGAVATAGGMACSGDLARPRRSPERDGDAA